jgi:hypothetical protein
VFLLNKLKLFFVSAPHNLPTSISAEAGAHVPGFKLFAALLALQRLLWPGQAERLGRFIYFTHPFATCIDPYPQSTPAARHVSPIGTEAPPNNRNNPKSARSQPPK